MGNKIKKAKIMVVEDEGITALRIHKSLAKMGYDVISNVFSGEDAVRMVEQERPDLVLMDIVLDGKMDGIEAAGRIHSGSNIPVVYLTAHSDDRMLKRIKATEPFGYIIKPFDDRELRIVVEIAFYKHEMQQRLKEYGEELERKVRERTVELESTIALLKETEKKLRTRAGELEESNTALKVLLKQRQQDRKDFEKNILNNIKHLIIPYLEKLKKNKPVSEDFDYLHLIEANLNEIVSPFSTHLSSAYLNFTPREMMIADFVKEGKQDKEIMELLHISLDTVKVHRKNIRKKLGINKTKINLRTKLLSLLE